MSVAKRQKWTEGECLDELLPRLEGPARTFVFKQLSEEMINYFKKLVRELENRFPQINHEKKPSETIGRLCS
jgi:hypothetical protein